MTRINQEVQVFKFNKGKITEATPFSFPENSALDLKNVILEFDGTVRRRKGIDKEPNASDEKNNDVGTFALTTFLWSSINSDPDVNFIIVQVGTTLYFYDADNESFTNNKIDEIDFTQTISPYKNQSDAETSQMSFASGNGSLFLTGKHWKPTKVKYVQSGGNTQNGTFDVGTFAVEVRDFDGVEDDEGLTGRVATADMDDAHRYNLQNQGWPDNSNFQVFDDQTGTSTSQKNPVDYFESKFGVYPANSDIFTLGLRFDAANNDVKGAFSPWQLKQQKPEVEAEPPRGHYILDFFDKTRTEALNVSDSSLNETINTRPEAIAFFSSRVWLAFEDKIFFSQAKNDFSDPATTSLSPFSPKFYQKQDPTSPDFNSLLPNDGGVIDLKGSGKVSNLVTIGNSIIAFSKEGVWQITGTTDFGFTATNFTVRKLTNQGVIAPSSVIQAGSQVFYWAEEGIYQIGPDENGQISTSNITIDKIQSDYDSIDIADKKSADGQWVRNEGKVYWKFVSAVSGLGYNILVYDIILEAFYTLSVDTTPNNESNAQIRKTVPDDKFKFLTIHKDSNGNFFFVFSEFNNSVFKDWATVQNDVSASPKDFTSFIETRYIFGGAGTARNKRATYILCYFDVTETGYKEDSNGNLVFDNPSACDLQVRWDFTRDSKAGKTQDLGNVYRLPIYYLPGGKNDPFDFSYTVAESKNKVRGSGKALTLKFTSQEGKDFRLLGFAMPMTVRSAI